MTGLVMLLAMLSVPAPAPRSRPAAGLWQKIEDGKPVVWVLVVDHDGIFEGVIAKTFPLPGEDPNRRDLLEMHRRPQERAGARNFLHPGHEAQRIEI